MIRPRYLVGSTGHRHLRQPETVSKTIVAALKDLKSQVANLGGELEFYGSIAYGADTLAAEAATTLGIPVHLILPKPVVRKRHAEHHYALRA